MNKTASSTSCSPGAEALELVVLPTVRAHRGVHGGLVLTRKFLNGMAQYAAHWPGPVTTLVAPAPAPVFLMDPVEVMPDERLGYAVELRPADEAALLARLSRAAVVLAFLSPAEAPLAAACRRIGVPLVYISEYSPRTERQIVDAQTDNPLLRWRRKLWLARAERLRRAALREAAGVQCSGTPTYASYRHVNPRALLFFDNRVREAHVIDAAGLAERALDVRDGAPLRLLFGGRLVGMKGVRQLPLVARELDRLDVPYTLEIYGGGDQEGALRADIERLGLGGRVSLHGVVDFDSAWVPLLKARADLFVCCHPQGDPSSTYPEVMACGVPIAGYDNEAFAGIVAHSGGGWLAPMNDPRRLAAVIAHLHRDREAVVAAAERAVTFARRHAFERTFAARTHHLVAASRLPAVLKDSVLPAAHAA
jgi:colanic acid/amylovoran biosynthesis glycosyltransferase